MVKMSILWSNRDSFGYKGRNIYNNWFYIGKHENSHVYSVSSTGSRYGDCRHLNHPQDINSGCKSLLQRVKQGENLQDHSSGEGQTPRHRHQAHRAILICEQDHPHPVLRLQVPRVHFPLLRGSLCAGLGLDRIGVPGHKMLEFALRCFLENLPAIGQLASVGCFGEGTQFVQAAFWGRPNNGIFIL